MGPAGSLVPSQRVPGRRLQRMQLKPKELRLRMGQLHEVQPTTTEPCVSLFWYHPVPLARKAALDRCTFIGPGASLP